MASKKRMAKKAVKQVKKHPKLVIALAVLLVIIIVAAAVLWYFKPEIFHKFLGTGNHSWSEWEITEATCGADGGKNRSCTVCGEEQSEVISKTGNHNIVDGKCTVCGYIVPEGGSLEGVENSELSIHFLELGNKANGDSILIDCGDVEVLIDAGSRQDSATAIKSYVDEYCSDGVLEYVIATHADRDHIAAFVGNADGNSRTGILYQYQIETLIMFDNVKPDKEDATLYNNFLSAIDYITQQGADVFTASQCYDETDGAKRQYYLDDEKKISLNILYNYFYYNVDKVDENNHSVVTLLTEELEDGNRHYLFTGDLEKDGESELVDYYSDPANSKSEYDILPEVELYKAGHHGSKTSSTEKLLKVIKPKYVAVCCSCGAPEYTTNNNNTFPTQIMLDNVGKYTDKIYVTTLATGLPEKDENGNYVSKSYSGFTSMNGNIIFYSEKGKLKLYCSNNDTVLKDTEWFAENRVWNGV